MRIAFNPSTVEALIAPPNNKDITFDLRGQNIFARGVKFCGTDTNTWRDIKINNVSIDSNILDLRDGDNTTLTNINGVVTINSTWRPVVDNLTSDSTTSSLSANQGRVLAGLINSKSDSDHNHDDRYLRLTGGTISGRLLVNSDSNSYTTPSIAINYYDSYTVNDYSITQIKMGNPKYDMYLGLSPAVKGRYGKIGYFMHADTDCEFLWGTSGWIKRMALECSSGNLWVSGSITAGKFHSNASASTDLTVIPPDTAIALETGNGNGVVNSWIWRENYTSSNWGIFHNNSEDDSINFVGNNRIRVKISLGSNSLKVGGTEVSLEGHNHDGRYVKRSGDTMLGALNFANGTWNLVGDDSYMGDCNVSGHFGIKAANTTYPGIAFFNNANDHLGNLTAYNGNIKYEAYSLQFLDNGNTSVSASTWTNPFNDYNSNAVADGQAICVWGQSSYLSNLANDTGDMSLWLKRVNANVATLNMVLDGEYYANGNQRLAHVSEIPTSLKNPYALTISLNGTSQGPYDGSAAKNINITPSSIGAAASDHNHDGRYVRYYAVTTLDCNNLVVGLTAAGVSATNAAHTNHSAFLYISDVGTPFQIQIPDSSVPYIYKRYYSSGTWSGWFKLNAGYADSAGSVAWDNVTGKPSLFNPAVHTHTVFNNNLMIKGTNGISDSASIHLGIGDSDTGFKWISDGKCQIYANNVAVGEWTSGGMNWFKNPTVNGNKIWNAGNDGSGSGLDADLLDGWHLDSIRKNVGYSWSSKYRINNWSRIIKIDNYSNILLAINFSQNSQASNHLYLISTGYGCGNIVQLGANGYSSNSAIKIRLTENTATSHNIEIYSTYGYNGATELSINCNYTRIDGNSTITTYLTYTAGGGTVRKEITSSYSKIVANLQGNSDTTTKLQTPRQINGTNFDGTSNITTSYWGATRTISLTGAVTGSVSTNGSGNITINTTYGTGNITNLDNRYVKKAGDTMQGNLAFASGKQTRWTAHGTSYITDGNADSGTSLGSDLANLVISSWQGVSFTTSCSGQTYTNKTAVGINCRTGIVYAAKFVGALQGNADTATKLQTARNIWGQRFDGTGNVSGSLSGVGHIQFSADNSYSIGTTTSEAAHTYTRQVWARHLNASRVYTGDTNLYIGYSNTAQVKFFSGTKQSGDGSNERMTISTNGNVGIGTTSPSYKLDVNGQMRARGFHHGSANSDNYILLAGGGYSQGVPVRYWAIYYMYIGNSSTDVTYTKRSGNYDFITSEAWESEGSAIFDIRFPSGYNKNNTLIFGNGDHRTSSWWRDSVYVTITTSTDFSSESKIRVMISDGANLNTGFANIYFMCMG